jgi:hypothetical protein
VTEKKKKTKVSSQLRGARKEKKRKVTEHLGGKKTKVEMQKRAGCGHFGKKTKVGMQTKTKIRGERMDEMKTKPNNISSGCGREEKQK